MHALCELWLCITTANFRQFEGALKEVRLHKDARAKNARLKKFLRVGIRLNVSKLEGAHGLHFD